MRVRVKVTLAHLQLHPEGTGPNIGHQAHPTENDKRIYRCQPHVPGNMEVIVVALGLGLGFRVRVRVKVKVRV